MTPFRWHHWCMMMTLIIGVRSLVGDNMLLAGSPTLKWRMAWLSWAFPRYRLICWRTMIGKSVLQSRQRPQDKDKEMVKDYDRQVLFQSRQRQRGNNWSHVLQLNWVCHLNRSLDLKTWFPAEPPEGNNYARKATMHLWQLHVLSEKQLSNQKGSHWRMLLFGAFGTPLILEAYIYGQKMNKTFHLFPIWLKLKTASKFSVFMVFYN